MNTYAKFAPNVFVAKCPEQHERGAIIEVTTKYGQIHECIVWNYLGKHRDGSHCYSITRADGTDHQTRAAAKADRIEGYAANAQKRGENYQDAANEGRDFLVLAEPIKVGHHSEKRHRALIERNHNRMRRAIAEYDKVEGYESRAAYWSAKAEEVNLSMPESIQYYTFKLQEAEARQKGLKDGTIPREHSYSLPYATKAVKHLTEQVQLAHRLWGE